MSAELADKVAKGSLAEKYARHLQEGRKRLIEWRVRAGEYPGQMAGDVAARHAARDTMRAWMAQVRDAIESDLGFVRAEIWLSAPAETPLGSNEPAEHEARLHALRHLVIGLHEESR